MIVLAIKGEGSEMRFNPPPDDVIHRGDHLIAMGDLHGAAAAGTDGPEPA